jgi:succinate dehydrogenase / fumarate reductase membrane anchor subunit
VLSLAGHAWVGIWTVLTDYVTTRQMGESATALRLVLQAAMVVGIIVFTVWGLQIFWH